MKLKGPTQKELRVLSLYVEGHSTVEIAGITGTSRHSVHNKVTNLYYKLGANNLAQLVYKAVQKGHLKALVLLLTITLVANSGQIGRLPRKTMRLPIASRYTQFMTA